MVTASKSRSIKDCGFCSGVVELTEVDENHFDRLLRYRQTTVSAPYVDTTERAGSSKTFVDRFGEIATRKIQQQQKRLKVTEIDRIIAEYQQGASTYQLATKYGCHCNTVTQHLRKNGVDVTNRKIGSNTIKEIIALYKGGIDTGKLAKQFGVAHTTVLKYLHSNGVEMRTRWDY